MKRPVEVRVAMIINAAAAMVFLLVAVLRQVGSAGDPGLFKPPVFLVLLAAAAVALLYWRPRYGRVLAVVAALLPVLLHLFVALAGQIWYLRVLSAVLAAGYVYSVVLLNTKPARIHLDGAA